MHVRLKRLMVGLVRGLAVKRAPTPPPRLKVIATLGESFTTLPCLDSSRRRGATSWKQSDQAWHP